VKGPPALIPAVLAISAKLAAPFESVPGTVPNVPETDLLLRVFLLAETDLENFAENLVTEKQYCFQISLKSSHGEIDKMLMTEFESSSAFVQIRKNFEKTGGSMICFYSDQEGIMGINCNLRSMQEPQSGT